MTVCLGIICVLLLVFIILQHISITAERESLFKSNKNTVQEFNQTINSLQHTELMTEKDQLKNNFNSLSQKKLELETRVNDLTAEENQLQGSVDSLNQKKLELETRVNDLTAEENQLQGSVDALNQKKLELETRVKDLTAEKNQLQGSVDSLNQKKLELETRVSDLTAEKNQLQGSVDSLNQKKLELETRVSDLTAEKNQLQGSVDSLNQKKLELESKVTSLSDEVKIKGCKEEYLWNPDGLFISDERKSWSDSRQYCRDRGADLVIINTEEKQRFISSLVKEFVWIGLSDIENEGNMKWVDNSPLRQGFWERNEPNDAGRNEDCIELNPAKPVLSNWNDISCSVMRKCVCEN
ncbi:CD209 antigen-like [Megalobrama amblycephala]|uniref:CD209 antigen-like n=1 Tax=Megalobrama amblycephala TaxID=75352 RepID=UPI002014086E|nr:CD209 antigen-like [Megalobrama amblycephala]